MLTDRGLYRLMTWLSPNFPVGAFSWSHGLEAAVESGRVHDRESLIRFVTGIIEFGAGRVDAGLFRAAWQAADGKDLDRLMAISEQAQALRGTAELALENTAQGRAFLDAVLKAWPQPLLKDWDGALAAAGLLPAYPVAVGAACAVSEVELRPGLVACLNAFAANLVSAALRAVPLGQTDGQHALAELELPILWAAESALTRDGDDFGQAALMVDWLSMQHETQYSRMFRS